MLKKLWQYTSFGWTAAGKKKVFEYHQYKFNNDDRLSIIMRCLIGCSESLKRQVLDYLHDGHIGSEAMKTVASQCVW